MSDIIEYLRRCQETGGSSVFKDAADEIERLRAALEGIAKLLPRPKSGGERVLTHYDPEVEAVFAALKQTE